MNNKWISLLTATALIIGFFTPELVSVMRDQRKYRIISESKVEFIDTKTQSIEDMLRMISTTDSNTVLQRGKKLTSESALYQARISLNYFIEEGLKINMKSYSLNNYEVRYVPDKTDLSNRLIVWMLEISCMNQTNINVCLDDETGIILGMTYDSPRYGMSADELIHIFDGYWGVESSNKMIETGNYVITIPSNRSNIEIPIQIRDNGFSINIIN